MAAEIRSSRPTRINDHLPTQSPHTAVPIGISEQETTITSELAASPLPFAFLHTIKELFLSICITTLETIISFLSSLASCLRGGPKEEPWTLPENTYALAEAPTLQPQPTPAETTLSANTTTTLAVPDPFSSLPINSEEKGKIFQIVHTLGTTSPLLLWPHQTTLERLGREIEHVHPLRFLEYILLHRTLRTDLHTIRNSRLLWPRFLEGLANKLTRERQDLPTYMDGFAGSLQIPREGLEPFLQTENWEAMTTYLISAMSRRIPPLPMRTANASSNIPPRTTESPTLIAPTTPVETPTTAPSPSLQMELSETEKITVANLIRLHKHVGYFSTVLGDGYVDSLWDSLNKIHPLSLLIHLFTNEELVIDLNLLWPYRLHRNYFVFKLVKILNRRPEADYLPHLDIFAMTVQKDPIAITAQIYTRDWNKLIKHLIEPNIE